MEETNKELDEVVDNVVDNENLADEIVDDIAKDLEEESDNSTIDETDMKTEEPKPFDLGSLSADQISQLKQMLASAPDRIMKKKGNPTTTLRKLNGKIVVEIGKAYLTLVRDTIENRDKETHILPIRYYGETEFVKVNYAEFMDAEKVVCEIISNKTEKKEVVEGTTISRETGTEVEMVRTDIETFFTLKVPEVGIIEISGNMSNR